MFFLLLGLSLFLQAKSVASDLLEERPNVNETNKHQVIREVAQKWIEVGGRQYQRSFFNSAERSLLEALGYREYLALDERARLDDLLGKTRNALAKRKLILRHIREANGLVMEGLLAKAKLALLKANGSKFLTKKERELIVESLKKIDAQLELEPEKSDEESYVNEELLPSAEDSGSCLPGTEPDIILAGTEPDMLSVPKTNRPSIIKLAEPDQKKQEEQEGEEGYLDLISRKQKLERSYGRAIVRDAVTKVRDYLSNKKFYKAKGVVAAAERAINANQMHLGDKLLEKYTAELKELSDEIEWGRKRWLGDK
jgi:hypothetical protein